LVDWVEEAISSPSALRLSYQPNYEHTTSAVVTTAWLVRVVSVSIGG
jgi:hypothetical protein